MSLLVGLSKASVTVYEPGMIMLGWVHPENKALGVKEPLYARALVMASPDQKIAYVTADLCFISLAVRQGVLEKLQGLGFDEHNLMLTATHTHSGPSGYSHAIFYNMGNLGFSRTVYEGVVEGITKAIVEADSRKVPASALLHRGVIPGDVPVAFNRSLDAYNANPDVEQVDASQPERAIDREAVLLRLQREDGTALGLVHWFAVHGTSVHAENTALHGDNKGVAARSVESKMVDAGHKDFVAIFSQRAAGDVSPNFRYDATRGKMIGASDDDFESAEKNGALQAQSALALFEQAKTLGVPLSGPLRGRTEYRDFSALSVDPEFAGGRRGRRTSCARYGIAMTHGTKEGPGPLAGAQWVHDSLHKLKRIARFEDAKVPFLEVGRGLQGRMLGFIPHRLGLVLGHVDAGVDYLRITHQSGTMGEAPWTPDILPLQLLDLGGLTLVGIPAEPTTVAGRRITKLLTPTLGPVLVNGYANAYVSYITTYEEYQLQRYEGASTHFGPHMLGGIMTALRNIASAPWARGALNSGVAPPVFDIEALERRRISGDPARTRKRLLDGLLGASA